MGTGTDAGDEPAVEAGVADPVTALVGEMHLHQFPLGGHAWTAFVDPPVALGDVHGQSITEIDTAITLVDGPCTAFVEPTCTPACDASAYCHAPNACAPLPQWTFFDAGSLRVTGSRAVAEIEFWFDAKVGAYQSDPAPGRATLFDGGEALVLAGGAGDFALSGEVPAPMPVTLVSPDPGAPLHVPASGPFDVKWQSTGSDEVDVLIAVSSNDGRATDVRCATSDTGELVVSSKVISLLPPAPRSTRLEVVRSEQRIVPVAKPGFGVLVHAAYSAWMNGAD